MENKMLIRSETERPREVCGVPFSIAYEGLCPTAFPNGTTVEVGDGRGWKYAAFAGMVNRSGWCSEWWGQCETNGCYNQRLFIGDRIGYIHIRYEDYTQDIIELIFGFNVWNYDLFHVYKKYENYCFNFGGGFNEPFASDPAARRLLDEALALNEDPDGDKGGHYMLAVKLREKPIAAVFMTGVETKKDDVFISGATLLDELPEGVKCIDPAVFLNRGYQDRLYRLAHRLYTYDADIPDAPEPVEVPKGVIPDVRFYGGRSAGLYTNVFNVNLYDMATEKVDPDGVSHTSSKGSVNFSGYVGLGTWKPGYGSYYGHMWTRDVGRVLLELAELGIDERLKAAGEYLHEYLDDTSERFPIPNWKRIANAREQAPDLRKSVEGKENDGHASTMLFIYQLWRTGVVDDEWVRKNEKHIFDAPNFFFWQMENPDASNFRRVLYSESEAATQQRGAYDLFSNAIAWYALRAYAKMTAKVGMAKLAADCEAYAARLLDGIMKTFVFDSEIYGEIFVDNNYDCWTYEYKRFAPLFLGSDFDAYDPAFEGGRLYRIAANTLRAQADGYLHPQAGRQMGYGQGYLCHTAAMLDDFELFTDAVACGSAFCYHAEDAGYLVPEGVIIHPTRRCWYRNCDQTNAVQQGEIVKVGRVIIGLDDLSPDTGLRLIPRLPDDFSGYHADGLHVTAADGRAEVGCVYTRVPGGYWLRFTAERPVLVDRLRVGPFPHDCGPITCARPFTTRVIGDDRLFVDIPVGEAVEALDVTVTAKR